MGDAHIRRDAVGLIPREAYGQVRDVVQGLEKLLGGNLVGVYLHGSAVLGCFGPWSDIDLVAVLARATNLDAKERLAELLLEISHPFGPSGPRPVELDVVVESTIQPWRYPTPFDFHYGESLREPFEAGKPTLWESRNSRDLAAHVTVLHHGGIALVGPGVEEVFPEVPWSDYVDALTVDLKWCRTRFAELPRYGVLSVARIWATLATGQVHSKASAAEWALPRLPAQLKPVLKHAKRLYAGEEDEERWDSLPLADYVASVAAEISRLT